MSEDNENQSRAIDGGISGDGLGDITYTVTIRVYDNSGTTLLTEYTSTKLDPSTAQLQLYGGSLMVAGTSTIICSFSENTGFIGLSKFPNKKFPDLTNGDYYSLDNRYSHAFYIVEYEKVKVEYNGKALGVVTKGCPLTLNCADKPMKSNVAISTTKMKRNPKNLISLPYAEKSKTMNGITFTVRDDGSVKVEGTSTDYAQFYLQYGEFFECGAGKPLTISGGTKEIYINLRRLDADGNSKWFLTSSNGNSETGALLEGEVINSCNIYIAKAGVTVNTIIKPMLVEGADAEPYYCSTWGRNPKNLIPFPYTFNGTPIEKVQTKNGVTFIVNDDGTITANGTATARIVYYVYYNDNIAETPQIEGGTHRLMDGTSDQAYDTHCLTVVIRVDDKGTNSTHTDFNNMLANGNLHGVYLDIKQGVTLNNVVFKPVISKGTEPLPYYSYEEFAW